MESIDNDRFMLEITVIKITLVAHARDYYRAKFVINGNSNKRS